MLTLNKVGRKRTETCNWITGWKAGDVSKLAKAEMDGAVTEDALVWYREKTRGVYAVQGSFRVLILLLALCPQPDPWGHHVMICKARGLWFGQLGRLHGGAHGKEPVCQCKRLTAPPEEGMATHSSIPAWKIPWTEKGYGPRGRQRVGHNLATNQQQHVYTLERWVPGQTNFFDLLTNYGLNSDNEGVAKPFSKNRKYPGGERQLWVRNSAEVRLRTSQGSSSQPAACPSPAIKTFPTGCFTI